jgi:hypothetical protein
MPFDGNEVGFEVKTEVRRLLACGLARLGPNGEHWTQGQMHADGAHCAIGSLADGYSYFNASRGSHLWDAGLCLNEAVRALTVYSSMIGYNDTPGRTFPEIRAVFLKAIQLAEAEHANG